MPASGNTRCPLIQTNPLRTEQSKTRCMEDPDALATRLVESEDFVRRNKTALLSLLAVVVLAVVGGFAFYTWRTNQNEKGQAAMYQAVNYWEADSLNKALKGDGSMTAWLL